MRLRYVVLILFGLWTTTLFCYISEDFWLAFLDSAFSHGGWSGVTLQDPTGKDIPINDVYYSLGKTGPSSISVPSGTWCFGLDRVHNVEVHCVIGEVDSRECGEGYVCGYVSKRVLKYDPPPSPHPFKRTYTFLFIVSVIFTVLLPTGYWVWKKRTNEAANAVQNEPPPT